MLPNTNHNVIFPSLNSNGSAVAYMRTLKSRASIAIASYRHSKLVNDDDVITEQERQHLANLVKWEEDKCGYKEFINQCQRSQVMYNLRGDEPVVYPGIEDSCVGGNEEGGEYAPIRVRFPEYFVEEDTKKDEQEEDNCALDKEAKSISSHDARAPSISDENMSADLMHHACASLKSTENLEPNARVKRHKSLKEKIKRSMGLGKD